MGRPDDRSKHGSVEHPWARASLGSFITASLRGLYEGPGREDALPAVTFVLPLLIMAPLLKRWYSQGFLIHEWLWFQLWRHPQMFNLRKPNCLFSSFSLCSFGEGLESGLLNKSKLRCCVWEKSIILITAWDHSFGCCCLWPPPSTLYFHLAYRHDFTEWNLGFFFYIFSFQFMKLAGKKHSVRELISVRVNNLVHLDWISGVCWVLECLFVIFVLPGNFRKEPISLL